MQITVTIREDDEKTLTELAARDWRDVTNEASALLEQTLHAQALDAQRAQGDPSATRRPRRVRAVAA